MWTRSWRIVLLGGLHAESEGARLHRFSTQKTAALLAYLAFYGRQQHPRETLIEMLWPEAEPALGRNSLSVALSSLRHQLEPPGTPAGAVIRADRLSVGLNPNGMSTDVVEFEAALHRAERAESETERAQHWATGLDLYQGPLLPGFYEDWIPAEQERLAQRCFDAAAALIHHHERTGNPAAAIALARRLIGWDPLREDAHHHLIRLLADAGQPGTALRQYRELERLLDEELGAVPSSPLRALVRRIEDQTGLGALPAAPAPPPRPLRAAPAAAAGGSTTLTFLLTDIEGSTRLWEQAGAAFPEALALHHATLRRVFSAFDGQELKESGDGFIAAFGGARQALAAAVAGQQELAAAAWPAATGSLRMRMVLHTGDVECREGEYHGLALHRAARMLDAAHGGQVLLSEATAGLVGRDLPPELSLLELGVYRLRDVSGSERLFQVVYPGAPEAFPPLRAEAGYAARLPQRLTRFFGREREIEILSEWLREPGTRLVTVTGPGGTGKTRVALEVAERLIHPFLGAVWFVALADTTDPAVCADTVLDSLGLTRSPLREPLDQVSEFLAKQRSLLVLDNFEQLVEGGTEMVRSLITRVPVVTCLVTSRRSLGLAGEREFPLPPLPIPNGPDTPERLSLYDSVRLFVDRAQGVRPDFQVTSHNAPAVAALCERLEGIPLAIELAAARAQVLTPGQMLAQVANRFELLTTRKRDADSRHRTLHAAVEWSYRLLTPELQQFFSRLSVFRGGWTVEAAEAVCEEPLALDYLAQLRECSLVLCEETPDAMRFRMLETLREYGAEQLSTEGMAGLQRGHAEYFVNWVEQEAASARDRQTGTALERVRDLYDRFDREYDNLRAAVEWLIARKDGTEAGLRLLLGPRTFWRERGRHRDARRWFQQLLEQQTPVPGSLRASAAFWAGNLAKQVADYQASEELHQTALTLWREMGDPAEFDALSELGHGALGQGRVEVARRLFEEALAGYEQTGHTTGVTIELLHLGDVAYLEGDLERAYDLQARSTSRARAEGSWMVVGWTLQELGRTCIARRDYDEAEACFREALDIWRGCKSAPRYSQVLEGLADVAAARGRASDAARLVSVAARMRTVLGVPVAAVHLAADEARIASLREALGDAAFDGAWEAGQHMDWEAAVEYALAESGPEP
jgi:predicted ATPase/DNA-binding SARP family transcriptional activator